MKVECCQKCGQAPALYQNGTCEICNTDGPEQVLAIDTSRCVVKVLQFGIMTEPLQPLLPVNVS